MKPDLIIINDKDWPSFALHKTNAAYERYGIVPGAFYHDDSKRVYSSEHFARQAFMQVKTDTGKPYHEIGEGLFEHELGHAWDIPLQDHPTTILEGIKHAAKVGFDTRAFTRLLRWNWCKVARHHAASRAWIKSQMALWEAGELDPRPGV